MSFADRQEHDRDASCLRPPCHEGKRLARKLELFTPTEGYWPQLERLALLSIYFVHGILGLARFAVSFFLKDELGLSPSTFAALMGIVALPHVLKPLIGLLSDHVPLWGYRRRSYLAIAGLLGSGAWIALATVINTTSWAIAALTLNSLATTVRDVVADSVLVEQTQQRSLKEISSLQSLCRGSLVLGSTIAAYCSGLLVQQYDVRAVFLITAVFPLLVPCLVSLIPEQPVQSLGVNAYADGEQAAAPNQAPRSAVLQHLQRLQQAITELTQALLQKQILLPMLFLLVLHMVPSSESALFFFSTNELDFQPEFLGRIRFAKDLTALLAIGLFYQFLKTVPLRQLFASMAIASTAAGLSTLLLVGHLNQMFGIGDQTFSLISNALMTFTDRLTWVPTMVLMTCLCPLGSEATFFALFMSVLDIGELLADELGAVLTHLLGVQATDFANLWLLILITKLGHLLPLFCLSFIPSHIRLKSSQ